MVVRKPVCGIYAIAHIRTKKWYIGQAQNIHNRWSTHLWWLRRNGHHSVHLQRVWNKHPEKEFAWLILEECSVESLDRQEQYWMDQVPKGCLTNTCKVGGAARGYHLSAKTKQKISDVQKRVGADPEERKRRSERAKKQHAEGRLGRKTYKVKPHKCRRCWCLFIPKRTSSGTLQQSKYCFNCRPKVHNGGNYKFVVR